MRARIRVLITFSGIGVLAAAGSACHCGADDDSAEAGREPAPGSAGPTSAPDSDSGPGSGPPSPAAPAVLGPLHVERITESTRAKGPSAVSRAGDWALVSEYGVRFVLTDLPHREGLHESGGNLVDLDLPGGEDVLDGLCTWLERTFPRQARYDQIAPGTDSITVSGVDSGNASVGVQTTWKLLPAGEPGVLGRLLLSTTVTNRSASELVDYELGDIVGWGGLRHFAPGPGHQLAGRDERLPWVGGDALDHGVILVAPEPLTGPHGSSWSDPVWRTVTIPVAESVTYERQLLVGRTLGALVPAALALQGQPGAPVTIVVQEQGTGRPVPGASAQVLRTAAGGGREPILVGRSDAQGRLVTEVPPGRYRFEAGSPARVLRSWSDGEALAGESREFTVTLSGEGRARLRAQDPSGRIVAARFTFQGLGDTPDPVLGGDAFAIGGNRAHVTKETLVPMPPGIYDVTVSHGPAWSLVQEQVRVPESPPGGAPREASVSATLRPIVPSAGWLQCDLHQHAAFSFDSSIPPVDGVVASAAEGLDCIATTEHDAVADWSQALAQAALPDPILWLPGIEVTSEEIGHFNAYPWDPGLGIVEHRGRRPAEVLAEMRSKAPFAVLQVNHPRAGRIGYFNAVGVDPDTGLFEQETADGRPTGATYDFDVLEVLNGKQTEHAEQVLDDWLRLLDARKVYTAVGTSDSHRLVGQERGVARTWVQVGPATTREGVVDALKRTRRATASTGPFLDVELVGPEQGGQVPLRVTMYAPEWMPVDEIEVMGGDPLGAGSWSLGTWTPRSPGMTESVADGLRMWVLRVPVAPDAVDGWVLAIARGREHMQPWMDCPALAVTNPLWLR